MGLFGKASAIAKGFAFYNPIILPFNDVIQQAMLTGIKGSTFWVEAAKDLKNLTPAYWEAFENGLFSQPFNIFLKDYEEQWKGSLSENKTLPKRLKKFFLNDKIVNSAYKLSSNIAWTLDRTIRMASYRYLLGQGLSPREAAQTAALFHGDYAMVDPNTRRFLNQLFFTPTRS